MFGIERFRSTHRAIYDAALGVRQAPEDLLAHELVDVQKPPARVVERIEEEVVAWRSRTRPTLGAVGHSEDEASVA
jgi:hypothetical protein